MYSLTITAGWWLLPFVFTVFAFILASYLTPRNYGGYLSGLEGAFNTLFAIVVSLLSWVIYLAVS